MVGDGFGKRKIGVEMRTAILVLLFGATARAQVLPRCGLSWTTEYCSLYFARFSFQPTITDNAFIWESNILVEFLVPHDRPVGESVSSRLFFRPVKGTATEQAGDLSTLKRYRIKWGDQVQRLNREVLHWKVVASNQGLCPIEPDGNEIAPEGSFGQRRTRCAEAGNMNTRREPLPRDARIEIPQFQKQRVPLLIRGPFNGDLEDTYLELNGKPVTILAESEANLLAPPAPFAGHYTVRLAEKGQRAVEQGIWLYSLNQAPDTPQIKPGTTNDVSLILSGLDSLQESVVLTLESDSDFELKDVFGSKLERRGFLKGVFNIRRRRISLIIRPDFVYADGTYRFRLMYRAPALSRMPQDILSILQYSLGSRFPATTPLVVTDSVSEWSRNLGVHVTSSATDDIVKGFRDLNFSSRTGTLWEHYTLVESRFSSYNAFVRFLTRTYLYKVREHSPRASIGEPQFFQTPLRRQEITSVAVRNYPFATFFGELWKNFSAKAWIEIDSDPHGMLVSIDHQKPKNRDITAGQLELRRGEHTIEVIKDGVQCRTRFKIECTSSASLFCVSDRKEFTRPIVEDCKASIP